jgi:hypothetical protein
MTAGSRLIILETCTSVRLQPRSCLRRDLEQRDDSALAERRPRTRRRAGQRRPVQGARAPVHHPRPRARAWHELRAEPRLRGGRLRAPRRTAASATVRRLRVPRTRRGTHARAAGRRVRMRREHQKDVRLT